MVSSPIRRKVPPQVGQVQDATCTMSSRDRCSGKGRRAGIPRPGGAVLFLAINGFCDLGHFELSRLAAQSKPPSSELMTMSVKTELWWWTAAWMMLLALVGGIVVSVH